MNKKKIVRCLAGVGMLSSVVASMIPISASAYTATSGNLTYDKSDDNMYHKRPKIAYFRDNVTLPKNPDFPKSGAYDSIPGDKNSRGFDYAKEGGQKLQSRLKRGYGYSLLYYAPIANSAGSNYLSPQADGALENLYTHMANAIKGDDGPESGIPNYNHYMWRIKNTHGWKGSETNFSKYTLKPNYGKKYLSGNMNGHSNTKISSEFQDTYDAKFQKYGEWRYLGYNLKGEAVNNSFFPTDGDDVSQNKSDQGLLYMGLAGGDNTDYKQFGKKSEYDNKRNYDYKEVAVEKLMEHDKSFKDGTIKYVDGNGNVKYKVKNGNIDTDVWMNTLSCVSDPKMETPKFHSYRVKDNGSKIKDESQLWSVNVLGDTPEEFTKDVYIKNITIYDSHGNYINSFSRDSSGNVSFATNRKLVPGNKYTVKYEIFNNSDYDTTVNPSQIKAGYAVNGNAVKNDYMNGFNNNDYNWTASNPTTIPKNSSRTVETSVVVPMYAYDAFKIDGLISDKFANAEQNSDASNDWGYIVSGIEHGDMGASGIELIDRHGNVINDERYMKPGEDYKLRYNFRYSGPDRETPTSIQFNGRFKRFLPGGSSEWKNYDWYKNNIYLRNGQSFSFETDYFTFENPKVEAISNLVEDEFTINADKYNDSYEKEWNYNYDVKVENVRVYNDNERPIQDGYITVGLKYDVRIDTPAKVPYFEVDLQNNVTIPGGQTLKFTDHVHKGLTKDITRELKIPVKALMSGSKKLDFSVYTNADRKLWENDLWTQNNNKGYTSSTQLAPFNPNITQGCQIKNTENNWNVAHDKFNYSGIGRTYKDFDGKSHHYYRYDNDSINQNTNVNSYKETYGITSAKFKSKYTADKKLGNNGWVEMKNNSKDAIIKAGYGYELEIEVKYNNNVFSQQPKVYDNRDNGSAKGLSVSNLQTPANVYKDIYVKTNDGKILSATGMYGTIRAFDPVIVKEDNNEVIVKYRMRNTQHNGMSTPMKIYTNENTADGKDYKIKVWTPTITGIGSASGKKDLCDENNFKYEIRGSMYDDTEDSIVQ